MLDDGCIKGPLDQSLYFCVCLKLALIKGFFVMFTVKSQYSCPYHIRLSLSQKRIINADYKMVKVYKISHLLI